jgi:hypothetical protein
MQLPKLLGSLLIASAISLTLGGILLFYYALVPTVLVLTTFIAVLILLLLSTYVVKRNINAINIATILGVAAPIISYFTPSHVGVLEQIGTGGLISLLGVLQLLGFYVFPITYVILRLVFHQRIGSKLVTVDSKLSNEN